MNIASGLAERPDWLTPPEDATPWPICDMCGKEINDDYYYEIGGDIMCESCMISECRHDVDEYIEEHEGSPVD